MGLRPRFLIEAGFIVAVAIAAGLADLSTWTIVGVVAAAWILVALVELVVWKRTREPAREAPDPSPSPEPILIRPKFEAPEAVPDAPREWNLWELERLARATAGSDAARDEERGYILMYLRDFANADGALPADFDVVVRESFGDVLDAVHS